MVTIFVDLEIGGMQTICAVSIREMPLTLLAAEKEEAKAVLTLFLKKQGLSNAAAARTINKSDLFIDHLVSQLHSIHKSRYLVGLPSVKLSHSLSIYFFLASPRQMLDRNLFFCCR